MKSPLLDNFGYLANERFAQQVMNSSYIAPPGTSEFAIEFLNILRRPPSLEETGFHLTPEMNRSGWKKQKREQPPNHQHWVLIIIKPHV